MNEIITPSNITFGFGVLAILFSTYNYFRNPQIKADKTDALFAQQLRFFNESNDRRFAEIQRENKEALVLATNHIHTVDTEVKNLSKLVTQLSIDVAKLGTIIEERIPKGRQN
jgi:hypothetical protein